MNSVGYPGSESCESKIFGASVHSQCELDKVQAFISQDDMNSPVSTFPGEVRGDDYVKYSSIYYWDGYRSYSDRILELSINVKFYAKFFVTGGEDYWYPV
jgi:hypothetical protein